MAVANIQHLNSRCESTADSFKQIQFEWIRLVKKLLRCSHPPVFLIFTLYSQLKTSRSTDRWPLPHVVLPDNCRLQIIRKTKHFRRWNVSDDTCI